MLGILEGVRIVRSGPQQSTCIDNVPKERDSYQHFHQDMTANQVYMHDRILTQETGEIIVSINIISCHRPICGLLNLGMDRLIMILMGKKYGQLTRIHVVSQRTVTSVGKKT